MFLSEVERDDMAKLSGFANRYFCQPKADSLVEAMKKSPERARYWILENY